MKCPKNPCGHKYREFVPPHMGFKARARKHRKQKDTSDSSTEKKAEAEGVLKCGIKGCDGWADKQKGGRSLGRNKALEAWEHGEITEYKGRVRVCRPCYRVYKKETKDNQEWV